MVCVLFSILVIELSRHKCISCIVKMKVKDVTKIVISNFDLLNITNSYSNDVHLWVWFLSYLLHWIGCAGNI